MADFLKKWQPKDVILLVLAGGGIYLLVIGNTAGWVLIGMVATYYGIDLTPFIKLGRNQNEQQ